MRALLDTNAVIYLQKGMLAKPLPRGCYFISVITEMELLSFHGLSNEQERWLRRFIDAVGLIDINRNIKNRAIELRKNYRLKLPDAIIAASAIENELELVTLDKDLDNKPGLHIYPIELKT